jgi:hypothetical protein
VSSTTSNSIIIKHNHVNQLVEGLGEFGFVSDLSPVSLYDSCDTCHERILYAHVENIKSSSGLVPSLLMLRHNIVFGELPKVIGLSHNKHTGRWEYHELGVRCELRDGWELSFLFKKGDKKSRFAVAFNEPGIFGVKRKTLALRINMKKQISKYKVTIEDAAGIFGSEVDLEISP